QRMRALGDAPDGHRRAEFESEDAMELVGPADFAGLQVPEEAAGLAHRFTLRQHLLAAPQRILGDFALRHVLHGADEQRASIRLLHDMADATYMLDGAAGGQNTKSIVYLTLEPARVRGVEYREIFGMDDASKRLQRDLRARLEF